MGIALGSFAGFANYTDRGWGLVDVLNDRLATLGVPVLGGLELGHGNGGIDSISEQVAATIGPVASLDASTGTLTLGPCVFDRSTRRAQG